MSNTVKLKNVVAVLLIGVLLIPVGFTSLAVAKSNPPIVVLNLYYPGTATKDQALVETKLNEILKRKIGVELHMNAISWNNYEPKLRVLIAAGEPLDLLFTAGWFNYEKYAKAGYLTDLNKYLDKYAPITKSRINPLYLKAPILDGKNYAIPTESNSYSWKGILLNKVLVDKYKLDITKIKQLSDLEPMLKIIKTNEKNVIPLFAKEIDFESLAFKERVRNGPGALMENSGTKLVNEFSTPEMTAKLKLYYSWSQSGYIQLTKQNKIARFEDENNQENQKITFAALVGEGTGELADSISYKSGLTWTPIQLSKPYISTVHALASMMSIPAASKHPELAMKVIELLHTDKQLLNILNWGVEDLHWIKSKNVENRLEWTDNSANYQPFNSWMYGNPGLASLPENEFSIDYLKLKPVFDKAKQSPILGLQFNEMDKIEIAINAVYGAFTQKQNAAPQDPAKALPELNKALKKAGIDSFIAEKQKQINQFISHKK